MIPTARQVSAAAQFQRQEFERAVTDMQWSTSPNARHTDYIEGTFRVEDEPGCFRPVSPTAEEARRVMCGAGVGALSERNPLSGWLRFSVLAANGASDWNATLEAGTNMTPQAIEPHAPASESAVVIDDVERHECVVPYAPDERVAGLRPSIGRDEGDVDLPA